MSKVDLYSRTTHLLTYRLCMTLHDRHLKLCLDKICWAKSLIRWTMFQTPLAKITPVTTDQILLYSWWYVDKIVKVREALQLDNSDMQQSPGMLISMWRMQFWLFQTDAQPRSPAVHIRDMLLDLIDFYLDITTETSPLTAERKAVNLTGTLFLISVSYSLHIMMDLRNFIWKESRYCHQAKLQHKVQCLMLQQ